jgi:hypothetical protein
MQSVIKITTLATLGLPTTVGSADAHRRKRQRSRGPTHPVRQAFKRDLSPSKPHGLGAIL